MEQQTGSKQEKEYVKAVYCHPAYPLFLLGFPGGSDSKESACNAVDPGLIPGLGSSPGEKNGYPPQYSCLENSMDRGALIVHGVETSQT